MDRSDSVPQVPDLYFLRNLGVPTVGPGTGQVCATGTGCVIGTGCVTELFGPIHLRASWSLFNYEVPAISFLSSLPGRMPPCLRRHATNPSFPHAASQPNVYLKSAPALCGTLAWEAPSLVWEPPVAGLGSTLLVVLPFLWSSAGLVLWSPWPPVLICGPRGCS